MYDVVLRFILHTITLSPLFLLYRNKKIKGKTLELKINSYLCTRFSEGTFLLLLKHVLNTLSNVETPGGEMSPPSIGIISDAIPEAISSKTGVSVEYVHEPSKKWYVFRASYGRVDKAADYLIEDGTYTYVAKRFAWKYVHGRRRRVLQFLIPNLLFAYTTKEKAEEYIKETPALSFLTYYYNHFEKDEHQKNPPLTVSSGEMINFIRATVNRNEHLLFVEPAQCHYKGGEKVKVVDGIFRGVEGKVARVAGQQRVIVNLTKVGLISTAYIPTAFIEKLNHTEETPSEVELIES